MLPRLRLCGHEGGQCKRGTALRAVSALRKLLSSQFGVQVDARSSCILCMDVDDACYASGLPTIACYDRLRCAPTCGAC